MKKKAFASLLVLGTFVALLFSSIETNAQRRDRIYPEKEYTNFITKTTLKGEEIRSIKSSSSINVSVYKSERIKNNYVEITTQSVFMQKVMAEIDSQGELSFRLEKSNRNNEYNGIKVNVKVYTTGFEALTASSSGDITIMEQFSVDRLILKSSSSGDILSKASLNIARDLIAKASSSGDIVLSGIVNTGAQATIESTSSGDVRIEKLISKGAVNLSASSSGDILIAGEVQSNDYSTISSSSSGDVKAEFLTIKNLDVSVSSSGDAKVNATNNLKISASSSGGILYKGYPNLNITPTNISKTSGSVRRY